MGTQGGPRCRGRNFNERGCCSFENPCVEGEGDCEQDNDCNGDLVCGNNNCKAFGSFFHPKDGCCIKPMVTSVEAVTRPAFPLTEPFPGQKCSGRNYQGRRCCTPENPCDEGEGDCDGPGDGGGHDGHKGCKGDLVCGSNNCMQFGIFYHEKDDCCEKPTASNSQPDTALFPGALLEPPPGQRCSGRNYQSRRCCTPENPCEEGEGDCDGPGDGGGHDGHKGCKGDLQCGSNNCRKFGFYFHEKDDCCEKPSANTKASQSEVYIPGTPLEPKEGQRCRGRNFEPGRHCCTPGNPCDEGEGDCDGPDDGGQHDGHAGCKGSLVCGTNNCKKF